MKIAVAAVLAAVLCLALASPLSAARRSDPCGHDTLELTEFNGTRLCLEKNRLAVYDTGAAKPRAWIDSAHYLRSWNGLLNTGTPRDKHTKPLFQKARRMAVLARELCREGYGGADASFQRAADVLAGLFGGDTLSPEADAAAPTPALERKGQELQKLEDQIIELFGEFQDNCPALQEAQAPLKGLVP